MSDIIPSIELQALEIRKFVFEQTRKFNKDIEEEVFPAVRKAPNCENIKDTPKRVVVHNRNGVAIGLPYMNYMGTNTPNARKCPHCDCLHFKSVSLGEIVECNWCYKQFQW